jgi:hypothetical protein
MIQRMADLRKKELAIRFGAVGDRSEFQAGLPLPGCITGGTRSDDLQQRLPGPHRESHSLFQIRNQGECDRIVLRNLDQVMIRGKDAHPAGESAKVSTCCSVTMELWDIHRMQWCP